MIAEGYSIWDGDTGPIYRIQLRKNGAAKDTSTVAVEGWYMDPTGSTLIARRPGILFSPKSTGFVDIPALGREFDWDGAGKTLVLKLKVYSALQETDGDATQLLANPSFDTDGNADGQADSWTLSGGATGTYAVSADDPLPPAIFGNVQKITIGGGGEYMRQIYSSVAPAVGELWSAGVWVRGSAISGSQDNNHAIILDTVGGVGESNIQQLPIGTFDWRFITNQLLISNASHTGITLSLKTISPHTGKMRYDDAFLFKGKWRLETYAIRVPVLSRTRVPKTQNQIAGRGGFEVDSNGDGFPDNWVNSASGITFSMEENPTNVYEGLASLKMVLAGGSSKNIYTLKRMKYVAGETWKVAVRLKTSGALTGSPSGSQWGIQFMSEDFNDATVFTSPFVQFGTNVGSFTEYTSQLSLPSSVDVLRIVLDLSGVSGTAWMDAVQLYKL